MKYHSIFLAFITYTSTLGMLRVEQISTGANIIQLKEWKRPSLWMDTLHGILSKNVKELIVNLQKEEPSNYPPIFLKGLRSAQVNALTIAYALNKQIFEITNTNIQDKTTRSNLIDHLKKVKPEKSIAVMAFNISNLAESISTDDLNEIAKHCLFIATDESAESLNQQMKAIFLRYTPYKTCIDVLPLTQEKELYEIHLFCTQNNITTAIEKKTDGIKVACQINKSQPCPCFVPINQYHEQEMYYKIRDFLNNYSLNNEEKKNLFKEKYKQIVVFKDTGNTFLFNNNFACGQEEIKIIQCSATTNEVPLVDLSEIKQCIENMESQKKLFKIKSEENISNESDAEECLICKKPFNSNSMLIACPNKLCKKFCLECLVKHFQHNNNSCPNCRQYISEPYNIIYNRKEPSFINSLDPINVNLKLTSLVDIASESNSASSPLLDQSQKNANDIYQTHKCCNVQ